MKTIGITTQEKFLKNLGILKRAEIISINLPFSKKADIYYRLKRLIDNKFMSIGSYSIVWKEETLPSGIYIINLSNDNLSISTKVILVK